MICDWCISIRFVCFCVSRLLLVIVITIEFARVFEKHSKRTDVLELLPTGFGKSLIY